MDATNTFQLFQFANSLRVLTGKTIAIRRIAVRETSVSQHHVGTIKDPLQPLVHHSTIYRIEWFQGGP